MVAPIDPAPGNPSPAARAKPRMARRWLFAILALTFLFVLMPFLFWEATWFGRPLNDEQLAKSLADREHPREVQHALSQIADRILSPVPAARESVRGFYPQVIAVAQSGGDELRLTAAWVMGQDSTVPAFHEELLRLLVDRNPMVRANAALALIRFGDASGLSEIRALLQPYDMPAPRAGTLVERMKPGETINPGTLLGRIDTAGQKNELRSQVPGTVRSWQVADGATVAAGQTILSIDPGNAEVWEALRALYVIGQKQDLPLIERYENDPSTADANLKQQAQQTAHAIETRP